MGILSTSPIIGKYLEYTGRKFWIIGGLSVTGVMFIVFGLLSMAENPTFIFIIASLARFISGMANAGI